MTNQAAKPAAPDVPAAEHASEIAQYQRFINELTAMNTELTTKLAGARADLKHAHEIIGAQQTAINQLTKKPETTQTGDAQ